MRPEARITRPSRGRGQRALALLAASLIVVAACGGDDDAAGDDDAPLAESTEPGGTADITEAPPDDDTDARTDTTAAPSGGDDAVDVPPDADLMGTVRLAVNNDVNTLDPHLNTATYAMTWLGPTYETLILATPDGIYHPQLATDWEFSDDGLTFTLYLRDDVTFHDGTPFNAEAVVANIERAKTIEGSAVATALEPVESVEVVDDYTVQFNLSEPSTLYDVLSDKPGTIASPAAFEDPDQLAVQPVGTGPFTQVGYEPGVSATFERNDDYWGMPAGVQTLEISLFTDTDALFNALRAGQIDIGNLTELQATESDGDADLTVQRFPSVVTNHVNLDIDPDGVFAEPLVRQALAHATDKEAFAEFVGDGHVPSLQYALLGTETYDATLDATYPYDPDRARELLAEAGYPDGIDFQLNFSARPVTTEHAEVLQQMWAESGFRAELVAHEPVSTVETCLVQKECDALLGGLTGRIDLAATIASVFTEGARLNVATTESPDIRAALTAAQSVLDPEERIQALRALNETMVAVLPSLPLEKGQTAVGSRQNVIGFDWALNQHPLHGTIYVTSG